jgi:hypothetical protein
MGDTITGQEPFDAEQGAGDEASAEQVAKDDANAEQEREAQAKPGPPPSAGGTLKDKPASKFHG